MNNIQNRRTIRQWSIGSAAAVFSFGVWLLLMTSRENFSLRADNYGFPLTYRRSYYQDFDLTFPTAFVFDVVLGLIVVITSGVCGYRWSASWSTRSGAALCLGLVTFGACLGLGPWIPLPLRLLLILSLVVVIPLIWTVCVASASWTFRRGLCGSQLAGLFPLSVGTILVGLGWWCSPHDIFYCPNRDDTSALIKHLTDDNPRIRLLATASLRELGPFDEPAVSAILAVMSDPDSRVRSNAFGLATRLGDSSGLAVPILLKAFQERDEGLHQLASLGPIAKAAVPTLVDRLPSSSVYSKLQLCEALWNIDRNTNLVVPALMELLNDDFGPIRRDAAELLGMIGLDARAAMPILQEMVDYVPQEEHVGPTPTKQSSGASAGRHEPTLGEMSEAEFYPQIREAAGIALQRIQRAISANSDR